MLHQLLRLLVDALLTFHLFCKFTHCRIGFDIKEPHYALSRSNSAVTFGVLSSDPTRYGSDEVMRC